MKNRSELLFEAAERYIFHSSYSSDNPILQQIADKMVEIEIDEMWMLTQN